MNHKEQTLMIWLVLFALCALGIMGIVFLKPDWGQKDPNFLLRVLLILAALATVMAMYTELTME